MSCSEDGSVRMWEIQDLPLPAEPASPGDSHTRVQSQHLSCKWSSLFDKHDYYMNHFSLFPLRLTERIGLSSY